MPINGYITTCQLQTGETGFEGAELLYDFDDDGDIRVRVHGQDITLYFDEADARSAIEAIGKLISRLTPQPSDATT